LAQIKAKGLILHMQVERIHSIRGERESKTSELAESKNNKLLATLDRPMAC